MIDPAAGVKTASMGIECPEKDASIPGAAMEGATRQDAQESEGGMDASGNPRHGVFEGIQGHEAGDSGARCACGAPLRRGTRGPAPTQCAACKRNDHREVHRLGKRALANKRARAARPRRRRLTAENRRLIAQLVEAGAKATGIEIPADVAEWVSVKK